MTSPAPRADRYAEITIRRATTEDRARIAAFQAAAMRILAKREYERHVIDRFIAEAGTMPADLIEAGRVFVLEHRGDVVATAGWRWQQGDGNDTLADEEGVGGHDDDTREALDLDTEAGPLKGTHAEISGLYVDPFFARTGLATWLLGALEADAARMGLSETRIAATLTGLPLCQKSGYRPYRLAPLILADGAEFHRVALAKSLRPASRAASHRTAARSNRQTALAM